MENIVSILVFVVIIAALAYFKSSKVKDFVDTRVFRKKPKEPEVVVGPYDAFGGFPGAFKAPSEAPKPVVATPTPKEEEKAPLEPLDYVPEAIPAGGFTPATNTFHVENTNTGLYVQTVLDFPVGENTQWIQADVPVGFVGQFKVTVTESPDSPAGDKPLYTVGILDNNQKPICAFQNFQYTGGTLTGATPTKAQRWHNFVALPGVSYQIVVFCSTPLPAKVILTINGTAM